MVIPQGLKREVEGAVTRLDDDFGNFVTVGFNVYVVSHLLGDRSREPLKHVEGAVSTVHLYAQNSHVLVGCGKPEFGDVWPVLVRAELHLQVTA